MARQRKDLERTTAIMSNIKNPWTPPGQETTPEQKKQISTQHSEGVKHRIDKPHGTRGDNYKRAVSWNKIYKEFEGAPALGREGLDMVAAPHEYVLGGGPVKGGFSLAKTGMFFFAAVPSPKSS